MLPDPIPYSESESLSLRRRFRFLVSRFLIVPFSVPLYTTMGTNWSPAAVMVRATVAGVNVRHQSPYTLRRLILYPIYQALQRYCPCHLIMWVPSGENTSMIFLIQSTVIVSRACRLYRAVVIAVRFLLLNFMRR